MSATLAVPVETDAYRTLYSGRDRKQFLHTRTFGVGASDAAAVLGFSKWRTPFQVWQSKTGREPQRDMTEAMEFGIALEAPIARRFSVRHGHQDGKPERGRPIGKLRPAPGVLQSKEFPWLLASPDRWVDEFVPMIDGEPAPLEIKTANQFLAVDWSGGQVPDYYQAQSQSQQLVTFGPSALLETAPRRWGWIVPLIGGNHMPEPTQLYFDRGFARYLIEYIGEWWVEHVEKDIAPALTLADDLATLAPALAGTRIVATPEIEALVAERNLLQPRMAADDKRDKAIKDEIRLFMLSAVELRRGSDTGDLLVGYDMPKTKPGLERRVDIDRLLADHPEYEAEYVTVAPKKQNRTMSFKKVAS